MNLADGQLAASSSTLLGAGTGPRTLAVTLHNTASGDQTVSLTVLRSGSTARTVVRAIMKQYETVYVSGLPLDASDILAGLSTAATSVDYLVSDSPGTLPFVVVSRDATGAPKGAGLLEECRDLLQEIA